MIFVCGTDKDYDIWSSLGNTGWDYNSLLPFFKKLEGNTDQGTVLYKDGEYHGTDGPLTVSKYGSSDPFIQVLKDGFNQTGYKFNTDWNSKEYNGLVEVQGTIKGGERMSAARAFLIPLKSRSNFKVMKGSFVEKVLFTGKRATGVKIVTARSECPEITVYARKEVIISAGAMGTPKLLLKSGIGRATDLIPFGIPQVGNLAVGENFQDHPKTVHFIKINPNAPKQTTLDVIVDASQYLIDRSGKFSNLNVMNFNAFINTTDPDATYPDAHYIFYRFEKSQEFIQDILWRFGFKQQYIDELLAINKDYQILMVFNHLPNPISRGTVKLRSRNVYDYPKTFTNWYNNPTDIELTLRGYKKIEDLIATAAFQTTSAELVKFNITECNPLPYPSDAYRKCYMKYFSTSGWHQAGTAKMGPASDVNAVVDPRLLVHGFENLRVADASIMPNVITVNTQCPTYMIGEKAADMIKFDNDPENS